jgi:RNA polymerase sigma-70 factor (ECF subfamily)
MARGRRRAQAGLETQVEVSREVADTGAQDPETAALSEEERRSVLAAIGSLEPQLREAVILRVLEGMSFKDLAETFNVPLSTASTWVRRALVQVRKRLAQAGMEGAPW